MATRTVVIEQLGADGVTFDGPDVTVVVESGVKGDTGDDGTLAGSTFGIGLYQETVTARTIPLFTSCPFGFTLASLDATSTATDAVNVVVKKNGSTVADLDVDTGETDIAVGVAFAAGDRCEMVFATIGTPTGFAGTLILVRS
jgi:hypothetical protein